MLITEDTPQGQYIIKSYSPNSVTINDTTYYRSLIVSAHTLNSDWPPQSLEALKISDLELALTTHPELLILGTGKDYKPPRAELLEWLNNQEMGYEYMDNSAACRTYSALSAEGRIVTVALILNPV